MSEIAVRESNHNLLIGILNQVKNHPTVPLTYITASCLLTRSQEVFKRTEKIHETLILGASDDLIFTAHEAAFLPIEALYLELCSTLTELIDSLPKPSGNSSTPTVSKVSVPGTELPQFEESYTKWLSYQELIQTEKKENPRRCHQVTSCRSCEICIGAHLHFQCPELTSKPYTEKVALVKKYHLCFNCLNKGHKTKDCRSKRRCQRYDRKHHTIIHDDQIKSNQPSRSFSQSVGSGQQSVGSHRQDTAPAPAALNSVSQSVGSGQQSVGPHQQDTAPDPAALNHIGSDLTRRFWEVEEPPHVQVLTKEEKTCEEHFQKTTTRDEYGRHIVSIPFNSMVKELGLSREAAVRRFLQVKRRLEKNPELKSQYVQFLQEYQQMGHCKRIPASHRNESVGATYYLPHHCVVNQSSSTTKVRVVFDGSARTTSNISLNEAMLVGGTVQDDLYDILLRFRLYPVALKADISKMFRQFKLKKEDADFHRIVWRENKDQPLEEFRLLTVTYGTACAPYLATRCLNQLGIDVEEKYPLASAAVRKDFYVDDLMSGANTEEEAVQLYQQLSSAISVGGMELRKWCSNSSQVLMSIPDSHQETKPQVLDPEKSVKALGVHWQPSTDSFTLKYVEVPDHPMLTKRKLLSDLAKVFDPLGLISPIVVRAKLLLQELWKLTLGWNEHVPDYIQQQWSEYQSDLRSIPSIVIPRLIFPKSEGSHRFRDLSNSYQLHGFADASEKAYGAVLYLRTASADGNIEVRMITSKTKVAPLQQVSLPRLELTAAVLLSELVDHVLQQLKLECEVHLWTDSTITLGWITASPRRWKTFVVNRVARIQELTFVGSWKHIAGVENPADLASRGASVSSLASHRLWWDGPTWLAQPTLPTFPCPSVGSDLPEERPPALHANATTVDINLLERFSSLTTLKRVTALLYRFAHNTKIANRANRNLGPLSPLEIQLAFQFWIKTVQSSSFSEDISSLRKHGKVTSTSKLSSLNPYCDKDGILRVGGRLSNSQIPENRKHQAILPGNCHLMELIARYHHLSQLHSGFQQTGDPFSVSFGCFGDGIMFGIILEVV